MVAVCGGSVTTPGGVRAIEDGAARVLVARTVEQRRSSDLLQFVSVRDARKLLEQFAEDWRSGLSAPVGGGSSGPSDPVLSELLRRGDNVELADLCASVVDRINRMVGEVHGLASDVRRLLPLEHPLAEMLARHDQARFNGAGMCDRCGEGVTGGNGVVVVDGVGVADKLASAYCPACYSGWRKSGLDRSSFNATWTAEKAERRARRRSKSGMPVGSESAGPPLVPEKGVQLGGSGGVVCPEAGGSRDAGAA